MEFRTSQPDSAKQNFAEPVPIPVDRELIRWALSLTPAERLEEHQRQLTHQWQLAEVAGVDDWDEWVKRSGYAALVWQRKDF